MGDIRILIVMDHYCPGWKAGGPVRAIRHLVAHLGDSCSFDVVTSDRDLGDQRSYPDISPGSWQACGKARVLYVSSRGRSLPAWRARLKNGDRYHVVYLNSLLSRNTIRVLILRRLKLLPRVPYLLAPRGELQSSALSLKPIRKSLWLALSRALGLYDGVLWHAATPVEREDIRRVLRADDASIHVAPDISDGYPPPNGDRPSAGGSCRKARERWQVKLPGSARLVFISRISPMKNLDYALRVLAGITGRVDLDIYGPIEDERYWRHCLALMKTVPPWVKATYRGTLPPDRVRAVFGEYDLFFFPSRGESFGHVVVESLQAGCPVLISDRTPWRRLADRQAGWDLPLEQPAQFAAAIDRLLAMDGPTLQTWSAGARQLARRLAQAPDPLDAHRRLFLTAARPQIRNPLDAERPVFLPAGRRP